MNKFDEDQISITIERVKKTSEDELKVSLTCAIRAIEDLEELGFNVTSDSGLPLKPYLTSYNLKKAEVKY